MRANETAATSVTPAHRNPRRAVGLPPELTRRANRVLRPRDAAGVYAQPAGELARLAAGGVLTRLAHGYAAIVPQHRIGDPGWRPDIAAAALGIAQADYGIDNVALIGLSAARHHGAIPRALAVATVAVPKQRHDLQTRLGKLLFAKRDVGSLDLEKVTTELGTGWVTTVEQTLLDLAAGIGTGGTPLNHGDLSAAARVLGAKADWDMLAELAERQHKPKALKTAEAIAHA
ncbi:MAG: type IV toxin-antitoxin system AbiEi family antitoxin [Catenulispora sp.]